MRRLCLLKLPAQGTRLYFLFQAFPLAGDITLFIHTGHATRPLINLRFLPLKKKICDYGEQALDPYRMTMRSGLHAIT